MDATTGGLLLQGLTAPIGLGASIYNSIQSNKINKENLQLQKDNFAYQKELNQKIMDRQDTEVQRRRADLEAAGMSPWLAAGQGATSGGAITTQAPQNNPNAGQIHDLNGSMEAMTSLADNVYNLDSLKANTKLTVNQAATEVEKALLTVSQKNLNEKEKERVVEAIKYLQKETEQLTHDLDISKKHNIRSNDMYDNHLNSLQEIFGPVGGYIAGILEDLIPTLGSAVINNFLNILNPIGFLKDKFTKGKGKKGKKR